MCLDVINQTWSPMFGEIWSTESELPSWPSRVGERVLSRHGMREHARQSMKAQDRERTVARQLVVDGRELSNGAGCETNGEGA